MTDVGAPKPFAYYDRRHYPTLTVAEGYARWAPTYDALDDRFDIDLLNASPSLRSLVPGSRVVDLGCGTGRIGAWLDAHGAREVIGVDLCKEMLDRANARSLYASTTYASVTATGLTTGTFDGAISSMVLDHVADLAGFFVEAHRLLRPGGWLAIVDFHPFFMMQGIPTHFPDGDEQVAVENHVHALRDFFKLAATNGFAVTEFDERFVTDEWALAAPGYRKYIGQPVTHAWVYKRDEAFAR
jgi:SAM-dependent methyltransferase